jgi:hypothetical protein
MSFDRRGRVDTVPLPTREGDWLMRTLRAIALSPVVLLLCPPVASSGAVTLVGTTA